MNINVEAFNVDTSDNPIPVVTKALNAEVPQGAIRTCCKGLKIEARVKTADDNAPNWYVGFVQVLKQARMGALYENRRSIFWNQITLPCYDSSSRIIIPWFNEQSRKPLAKNLPVSVSLRDFPTALIYTKFQDDPGVPVKAGNDSLTKCEKFLDFDVFLYARHKIKQDDCQVLKYLSWTTEIVVERSPAQAGVYTATRHVRNVTPARDGREADKILLPKNFAAANNTILKKVV